MVKHNKGRVRFLYLSYTFVLIIQMFTVVWTVLFVFSVRTPRSNGLHALRHIADRQ